MGHQGRQANAWDPLDWLQLWLPLGRLPLMFAGRTATHHYHCWHYFLHLPFYPYETEDEHAQFLYASRYAWRRHQSCEHRRRPRDSATMDPDLGSWQINWKRHTCSASCSWICHLQCTYREPIQALFDKRLLNSVPILSCRRSEGILSSILVQIASTSPEVGQWIDCIGRSNRTCNCARLLAFWRQSWLE